MKSKDHWNDEEGGFKREHKKEGSHEDTQKTDPERNAAHEWSEEREREREREHTERKRKRRREHTERKTLCVCVCV